MLATVKHETFPPEDERAAADARRDDARAQVTLFADVKVGFGEWQKARLHDISPTGFKIGWMARGGEGSTVSIRLPGMELLRADIRWRSASEMGCEFTRPLSIYVFEHLVRSAG